LAGATWLGTGGCRAAILPVVIGVTRLARNVQRTTLTAGGNQQRRQQNRQQRGAHFLLRNFEMQRRIMNESDFLNAARAVLDRVEESLDACGLDIDIERKSDGVLDLEFENASHIVVNLQTPMRQIWIAAKAGGFHFEARDGVWCDTRSGDEFFVALSRQVSAQSGTGVVLAA
jgi:CyaY protein